MVKVDAKPSIRLLTKRFMKTNKARNIIAVLAVVMTTILFTSLFTAAISVMKSNQQQEIRNCMDSSHISIQDMTKEQFDQVKTYKEIQEYGYSIFLSIAENDALKTSQTEIRYADDLGAKSYLSYPIEGTLPQKEDQVALSTITLDLLGVPHKVGSRLSLTYTASGKTVTKDFTLSGYWKGDPVAMAQEAWISKDLCDRQSAKATKESIKRGDYEGDYNISIWCSSIFSLNKNFEQMKAAYDLDRWDNAKTSLNPAYDIFAEDAFPYGACVLILCIIFVSGYLIIYNVFFISVQNDIRTYGLLKNIGTTGRQLKQIVRRQAWYVSAAGIPIGLIAGTFIGRLMTPYLLADIGASGADKMQVVFAVHPLIYFISVLFVLITVFTACLRPCHIVQKISPVEAVRMTRQNDRAKRKRTGRINPFSMGMENMRRTWKKTVIVIVSLTLPIMVLNSIYMIVQGFDFDMYMNNYMSSDINVSGVTSNLMSSNLAAVKPELVQKIRNNDETKSLSIVYDTEVELPITSEVGARIQDMIDLAVKENIFNDYQEQREKELLESGKMPAHIMGINKEAFEKMEFLEGEECTWEEFSAGQAVIVSDQCNMLGSYYMKQEQMSLPFQNDSKSYTVVGKGTMPYDMGFLFSTGSYFAMDIYMPEQEYLKINDSENAMMIGIDAKEGQRNMLDQWIREQIEDSGDTLYVSSRDEIEKSCQAYINKYYMVLGLLCIVLMFIGVLNFFNTSAVSIMSRRKELSLLEAVGMSKKQVQKMLLTEGLFYLMAAVILADTVGTTISTAMIDKTVGRIFFFNLHVSILPSIMILPVFFLIAIGVPLYNYKKMCKETIVERIRNE